jgi:hypothetical protein
MYTTTQLTVSTLKSAIPLKNLKCNDDLFCIPFGVSLYGGGHSSGEITRQKSHLKLSDSGISPVASENPDGCTFRGGIFMKAIYNNFLVFFCTVFEGASCVPMVDLPWQGVAVQSRPRKIHNTEYNPKISTS